MRRVGDGAKTLFWSHRWIGGILISVRFRRLFDLAENKTITVTNFFSLGLAREGDGWSCRHRLWVWEEDMLEECRALLFDVFWFQMFQINGCVFQTLLTNILCEVPMIVTKW